MKLKLETLAGNHQFHYLTGKHKMFNVTVNIINFLQKFVQPANFSNVSTEILLPSAQRCSLYFDAEILLQHNLFV